MFHHHYPSPAEDPKKTQQSQIMFLDLPNINKTSIKLIPTIVHDLWNVDNIIIHCSYIYKNLAVQLAAQFKFI